MKLMSKRFSNQNNKKEFEAEVYQREDNLIITHTSLKHICWYELSDDERPKIKYEPVELSRLPGIPPMFAVKCIMESKNTYIEQVGEMLCMTWENSKSIVKENPVTICMNRAFDKAFILFMEFKIPTKEITGIYSSEEIPIDKKAILLKNIGADGSIVLDQSQELLSQPNDINSNFHPEANFSQQFPWNNDYQESERNTRIPDQIPQPVSDHMNVRRISWDNAFQKSKIETSMGIFIYEPQTGVWESQSIDMQSVDTGMLYDEASRWLGFDLCNFRGF